MMTAMEIFRYVWQTLKRRREGERKVTMRNARTFISVAHFNQIAITFVDANYSHG